MVSEARKLHVIEEVLKIKSDDTLSALEDFLRKAKIKSKSKPKRSAFAEFSGIWSKEEAEEIERAIKEGCETIHPDDWK
ncbi:hypothetical protein GCM10007415_27430 [Parapedobacter pyrenivorans]|uniref:DUF2281 domain-containing protein n=1 Tax=Parapedobacter pyrenivorans TaxID=1305674 RepID=A0A917HVV8_9SPHI|nr:hypothetical protein [Parapedobacter pyrenivorans]GGG91364.1 hypothetical protein GCM10007415_27430 [Parapedobacter pyrenivorans]